MALKVVLPGEMLFMGIYGYMVWERGMVPGYSIKKPEDRKCLQAR